MTRRFTRILAAFALLVFMTPSMVGWGQEVTLDFTSNDWELPVGSNAGITGPESYTSGDYTISLEASTKYYYHTDGYLLFGKANSTLTLPAFTFDVEKIEVVGRSGASGSVVQNIFVGDVAVSTATTGATGTNIYNIATDYQSAGNVYVLKVTSAHNTQVTEINIYKKDGGSTPTTYNVTVNQTTGGTIAANPTQAAAGTTITLTATPAEGYSFGLWSITPNTVVINNNQFTMPASNVTVSAQWTENTTPTPGGDLSLTFDLSSNPGGWPTSNSNTLTNYTYTLNHVDYVFSLKNVKCNSGYLMMTSVAVLGLPAIEGYKLTKVVASNSGGCSTSTIVGISSSDSQANYIAGGEAQTWSTTSSSYTYNLTSTEENTMYYMYVTNKNAQVTQVALTYEAATAPAVATPTFNPAAGTYNAAQSVTISCETQGATIYYTTDGTAPTNASTQYNGAINVAETTTIKARAFVGEEASNVATATYVIDLPLSTMDQIYAKALQVGGTATTVNIAFNNWLITGANNSHHAFLTEPEGAKGCMIYQENHGFTAGDVLNGTVECKVQMYNNAVELTLLTSTSSGLTVAHGGNVTVANIAMADLQPINTGALVSYQNLTCSVSTSGQYTNYNLTDGTTTIQAYTTLYGDFALEDGKTYNITGVYCQNNSTKRVNPRGAADISEVEVQHEEYTLTVSNLSHVNLFIFGGEDSETIISTEDGETTAQVLDGTEVTVSIDVEAGYVFQSLTITDANGNPVQMVELTANEYYGFTMPASNVTITATAVENVAPAGGNYVRITSLEQLTDGSKVIIAARRYENQPTKYYAMPNTASGKPTGMEFISTTSESDEVLPTTIVDDEDDYYWIVNITTNGYTFTNANSKKIGYSGSGTDFEENGSSTTWTIERTTSNQNAMVGNYTGFVIKNGVSTNRAFAFNGSVFGAYATSNMNASGYNFFLDFFVQTEEAGIPFVIEPDQWYLIASPVGTVDIDDVENLTSGTHGLYSFDQTGGNDGKEWRNYKAAGAFSQLEAGTGYLYINQGGCTLTFTGTPYTGTGTFQLVYSTSTNITERFRGLNLVGNPYAQSAAIDRNYYIMNANGTDLAAYTSDDIVPAMQGVFVKATEEGEYVTFTPNQSTTGGKGIEINLSQNRGTIVDRAIVRFGEGSQLSKVQLFENSTKLYIPQNGKDYAIVSTEAQGELPVNFRASENGTYTLSMDVENMDMNYLHLIDNMTGMDIDLLQTPSYTFEATTRDYESRFRLVFAGNNANADSDNFAFFSNGNLIINNEGNATLQVVDLTGRILSSETINGSVSTTINAVPGVYMLRLINGENVNVQKIVVR